MRQIVKNIEPQSLTKHRAQKFADYDNYAEKDDVRRSMCLEQRGICCYCMGSITPDSLKMKIEHFQCQDDFPKKQLDYSNMLGACLGNMNRPEREQHCDTFKGNKHMSFSPSDSKRDIGASIKYNNDGSITSSNANLDKEINEVLNLNTRKLIAARKGALDGFKEVIKRRGKLHKGTVEKWLADWEGTSHGNNLRPYCMVIAYWLRKKLN